MKKILKATAIAASAFIIGSSLTVGASWKDSVDMSYALDSPHAKAEMWINGEVLPIINTNGTLSTPLNKDTAPYVEGELFTEEDIRTLSETNQLAKSVTMSAETVGEIGLNNYSLQWDSGVMEYQFTESSGNSGELLDRNPQLVTKGTFLENTDPARNKIVNVTEAVNCTTDLLDDPQATHTPLLQPHQPGEGVSGLSAINIPTETLETHNTLLREVGLGADEKKVDYLCVLLELPERKDIPGMHSSTTTVSAQSTATGEKINSEDQLEANTINEAADYSVEAEQRITEGLPAIRMEITPSHDGTTIYNPGNYSYTDLEQN